jgi:hypothetical protein
MERFASSQFCDDIRQEVGGKFSLIGCYGTSIQIDPLPSVLPKLCVAVKVYTPLAKPFGKLTVRVLRGDAPLAELPFQVEALALPTTKLPPDARWQVVGAMIVMSPFPVEAACTVRVEAETEEGTIACGTVWINGLPQPDLNPAD